MSPNPVKRSDGSQLNVVRESKMPPYRYQDAGGGSGSLSSTSPADQQKKLEALRNVGFDL
jgi:hypothetical protein